MFFKFIRLVVPLVLLASTVMWTPPSLSPEVGNSDVLQSSDPNQDLSGLLGSEIVGNPQEITVVTMTAFEWEALNIEADKGTLAKLRAEGRFPPEIADQIPDPAGIVPVYPRGPERMLMVIDLRGGIQYRPKMSEWENGRTFNNVQVIIDLALATPIQFSAQSSDSTFSLQGNRMTPEELNTLLNNLRPTETPESDWLEDSGLPSQDAVDSVLAASYLAGSPDQNVSCAIHPSNTRGLLTYNGSNGYQANITIADPYVATLGSMSWTRVGNGDPYINAPTVSYVEIGWAKDLCWITPNPPPGTCSFSFENYASWKLATRHFWLSDGIRGYRGGDIANAPPGQTHFYKVEYVAPGWKLYVDNNEIAYIWTGHWRSYPIWSGCGSEVTGTVSTHIAASSCLNNAFRLDTTWYYVGGWWCAEETFPYGRVEALPGYSWRTYDTRTVK